MAKVRFKITDPVYNLELDVCIGVNFEEIEREMADANLPPLDIEQKPDRWTNAMLIFPDEWNRSGWLWFSGDCETDDPNWHGIIAHEMFHVAMKIFKTIGDTNISEFNEEPFAYYLKFIVTEFYKKARELKKSKGGKNETYE